MMDQMKMVAKLKKAQGELKKELVEVEAGDGAVVVQVNGEMKMVDIKIDPELVDLDDIKELEGYIKEAVREAMQAAQELAAEKMKPLMGGLGQLGL